MLMTTLEACHIKQYLMFQKPTKSEMDCARALKSIVRKAKSYKNQLSSFIFYA